MPNDKQEKSNLPRAKADDSSHADVYTQNRWCESWKRLEEDRWVEWYGITRQEELDALDFYGSALFTEKCDTLYYGVSNMVAALQIRERGEFCPISALPMSRMYFALKVSRADFGMLDRVLESGTREDYEFACRYIDNLMRVWRLESEKLSKTMERGTSPCKNDEAISLADARELLESYMEESGFGDTLRIIRDGVPVEDALA